MVLGTGSKLEVKREVIYVHSFFIARGYPQATMLLSFYTTVECLVFLVPVVYVVKVPIFLLRQPVGVINSWLEGLEAAVGV